MKLLPRIDNTTRTQSKAIELHNSHKQIMASTADSLQCAQDESQRKELHKDWGGTNWQVTSTLIDHGKKQIIHHYGSKVTKQKVIQLKSIPVCSPTYLNDLLGRDEGFAFVRAIADKPRATKEQLVRTFEKASGKDASDIRFWISSTTNGVRAVWLCFFGDGRFNVDGDNWIDGDDGLSRGVKSLVPSAKQTAKKGRKPQ